MAYAPKQLIEKLSDKGNFVSTLGTAKTLVNHLLEPLNMRLSTRVVENLEDARLLELERTGHFNKPILPILEQFRLCNPQPILDAWQRFEKDFSAFALSSEGTGFSLENEFFRSPDAEILYTMVRLFQPRQIVEAGSGNSTKLFRQAIQDENLASKLISIDPQPRCEVGDYADEVVRGRVEGLRDSRLFSELEEGSFLFIDSSHEIKSGNDVVFLLLNIIPTLAPGVIIHIHDIFLPYEYPRDWVVEWKWNWTEQYLVQAMLQGSTQLEVLWPGYYLQRTLPDLAQRFPLWHTGDARSLWLRRTNK